MAKMNVNRGRGGDDDFGDVGTEPTIPAKYAGTCATCRQRFAVGDPIAATRVDKKTTYHHEACRYPASALLEPRSPSAGAAGVARPSSQPGTCRATTSKGKPCNNAPQKGEQFCGPHLTQLAGRSSPASRSSAAPDPHGSDDSDDQPF